jgi:hypothetical protein
MLVMQTVTHYRLTSRWGMPYPLPQVIFGCQQFLATAALFVRTLRCSGTCRCSTCVQKHPTERNARAMHRQSRRRHSHTIHTQTQAGTGVLRAGTFSTKEPRTVRSAVIDTYAHRENDRSDATEVLMLDIDEEPGGLAGCCPSPGQSMAANHHRYYSLSPLANKVLKFPRVLSCRGSVGEAALPYYDPWFQPPLY